MKSMRQNSGLRNAEGNPIILYMNQNKSQIHPKVFIERMLLTALVGTAELKMQATVQVTN